MSRALQCLPFFQIFFGGTRFEKVKDGRPGGDLLAIKKRGY